jgi:pimeloyl-ACP methyl ester carboxylesterase
MEGILLVILKFVGCVLAAVIVLLVAFVAIVRGATWFSNRISTSNGVDEGIYVPLGGQEQYLLIRGEDVNNPVIIWLHGGPSCADAYENYIFQKYLTHDYTVVNWDQRGCGRTYFRNKNVDPDNITATFDQAQADLDELVNYVCGRFDTDRVILIGHSYGTILGSKYALEHPDRVSAYIGVGQVVYFDGEELNYRDALEKARANGDDTTEMEQAYMKYHEEDNLVNMMMLRSKISKYHVPEKQTNTLWIGISSPYMGIDDLRWFLKQTGSLEDYFVLNKQLYDYVQTVDVRDYGTAYQVPVGILSGDCDWVTPVQCAQDYYNLISAPRKQIRLLDGCGHSPQYDSPEEFSEAIKAMLAEFFS